MGWLAEQSPINNIVNDQGNTVSWKAVFAAITDKDFLLYDAAPVGRDEWARPYQRHSILATRLVHSGKQMSSLGGNEVLTFGTRSGTRQGVEAHVFRVETQRDLSSWSRALVQGTHQAAVLIKEVSCPTTWQNQECRLTLHYDNGFTLTSANVDDNSKKAPVLWHFPYEKLRMSADDGMRLLWLDFGEDGEQEIDVHHCPKPMVFILQSFLASKVARMGMIA